MSRVRTGPGSPGEDSSQRVIRQSALTSVVALVAVLSGLVLDVVVIASFGAGTESDAFVLAARLPLAITAIAIVVANQVLVPTFTAWETDLADGERARATSGLLVIVGVGASAVAGLMAVAAYPVMRALAPTLDPSRVELAASLARTMVWFVPCVLVAELFRAWLNARYSFAVPAAMTLLLNVTAVSVILLSPRNIAIVPTAYVAGAAVEVLVLIGMAVYRGWRPAAPTFSHPQVRVALRRFARPALGAGLNPLMRTFEMSLALLLPAGAATILHYGNRVASAVGGTVVFRSLMVALLPRQTRAYVTGDQEKFQLLVGTGLRLMSYVSVPMGVLGVALAKPASIAVFQGGRFDAEGAALLGAALMVYAASFPGSGLQRALLAPFYAMRDTRTPLVNTVLGIAANAVLLPAAMWFAPTDQLKILAVAAAYSASQYVNVAHAWWAVRRKTSVDLPYAGSDLAWSLGAATCAVLPAAFLLSTGSGSTSRVGELVVVIIAGLVGVGIAFAVLLLHPRSYGSMSTWSSGRTEGLEHPERTLAVPPEVVDEGTPMRLAQDAAQEASSDETSTDTPTSRSSRRPGSTRISVAQVLPSVAVFIIALALTAYIAVSLASGADTSIIAAPVALTLALALAVVAYHDVEVFLLCALALRTSLDAVVLPGSGVLDPGGLLGMVTIGVGGVWIVSRRIELGKSMPVTWLGVSLVFFLTAAAASVPTSAAPFVSAVEFARISSITLVFLLAEQFAARRDATREFIIAIGAALVLPTVVALTQLMSGRGLFEAGGFSRIRGTFTHSNPLAYFCLVVFVLALAVALQTIGTARAAAWSAAAVSGTLLVLTYTRSAWIAAVLATAVMLWYTKRRALVWSAIAIAVVVAFVPSISSRFADLDQTERESGAAGNSLVWRVEYWGESLGLAKDSPIAGLGLKAVAESTDIGKPPHNDFVRAYVEMGVLGLVAFAVMIWSMLRASFAAVTDAARRRLGGLDMAVAATAAGISVAVALLSVVANLLSQVVMMWYAVAIMGLASGALLRRQRHDRAAARGGPRRGEPTPTVASQRPRSSDLAEDLAEDLA